MRFGQLSLAIGSWLNKAVASGSTLLNGLVSYWTLDEVSGVRYDSVGENDLTDNNTVGVAPRGPTGTVADLTAANTEYLTSTAAMESQPTAVTLSLWVKPKPTVADGHQSFCIHGNYMNMVGYAVGGKYAYLGVGGYDGVGYPVAGTDWGPLYFGTGDGWMLLTGVWDNTSLRLYLNGETHASWVVATAGPPVWVLYAGVGRTLGSSFGGWQALDAYIADHGVWGRALSQDEIRALYNSGNGLRYSELSASLKTDLFNWYACDEASGVRYDSHSTNHLTDNNTVSSATSVAGALDGGAASFVAANSEKLTLNTTALTMGSGVSHTWSFWWKDTSAGTGPSAIIARDNATTREWAIYTGNTVLFVLVFDGGGNLISNDSFIAFGDTWAKNAWHHGIVWYDNAIGKLYYQVDGGTVRELLTGIDYVRTGTGPLEIGASTYYAAADLALDEIAVWDRVLTVDERAELYAAGAGKFYPFEE